MYSRLAEAKKRLKTRLARRGISLAAVLTGAAFSETPAAVAGPLAEATAAAAMAFTSNGALPGTALSSGAVPLAKGVSRAMFLTKLKVASAVLLTVSIAAAGSGIIANGMLAQGKTADKPPRQAEAAKRAPAAEEKPRLDLYGDPLPQGAVARLGTVRLRHGNSVSSLVFTPDGKSIVAADWSAIRIWDAATGKNISRIGEDFRTSLRSSSLSADGKRLATSEHEGGAIQIWDVSTGQLIRHFQAPRFSFAVIAPDGEAVASYCEGNIQVWNVASGKEVRAWSGDQKGVHALVYSPDSKVLVSGGHDKTIHVWNARTGQETRRITGHNDEVGQLLFSPDGKILTSVGYTRQEFKHANGTATTYSSGNKVHVWDFASGKEMRQLTWPAGKAAGKPFPNGIGQMAFSHDGRRLAATSTVFKDQIIPFWDVATGKEVGRLTAPFSMSLAFSPDDRILATGTTDSVRLWDPGTGKEVLTTQGHQGSVNRVAFSPDGRFLASTSIDGTVRIWEAATGKERRRLDGLSGGNYALAYSSDGGTIASAGTEKTIRLWDVVTGKKRQEWPHDANLLLALAFSPDGRTLASANEKGVVTLRDALTGKSHELKAEGSQLAFSADSNKLYSWGAIKAQSWDSATGKKLQQFHAAGGDRSYPAAALAPNGKWLACVGPEREIIVYDFETGKETKRFSGLPGSSSSLVFSPDSRALAWGGSYGERIVLLEVRSGQERTRFLGHPGRIHSLAFSPDGKRLASGSEDSTVLVWDALRTSQLPNLANPSNDEVGRWWSDLAAEDASQAYRALGKFVAAGDRALPLLGRYLKPVERQALAGVTKLITDLDSDEFKVREKATTQLANLGESAEPSLRRALQENLSAESRARVTALLEKIDKATQAPEHLRLLRTLEVLEHIATPAAQEVLQSLGKGAPEARLTQEAKASLARLAGRDRLSLER